MSDSSNTIIGILAGTAIGAALGILFAPDKGSNTRRKLKDETSAIADNVANEATHIRDQIADSISTNKGRLEHKVESIVSDASYKTEDLITTLEGKLKELKAKNKKLQQS